MPLPTQTKLLQLNIIHAYFSCKEYTPEYRPFLEWNDDARETYAAWEPYWKVRKRASGLFNQDLNRHLAKTVRQYIPDTPRDQSQRLIGSSKSLAPEKLFYARWSNR